MKDILFTTADFIRSVTIVSDNLQDKYILSSIREAQDIEFQQVVGTRLYNRLKLMVEDESILLDYNEHYRELLDKAQYFIAYQTLANLTVNSTYKINNVGLNTISDDNVSTPSLTDTFKLSRYYTDKADHYKMMLQNWLLKNKSYFPELLKSDISELSANVHSAASCNVFLGGARGKVSRVPSTLKDESQEASKPFTTGELNVTENGVYLPKDSDLDAFNKVTVDVQPNLQTKTVEITENGQSTIEADSEYYGLQSVNLNVNLDSTAFKFVVPDGMKFGRSKTFNPNNFDVSQMVDMSQMFYDCDSITSLDLSSFNTSNAQKMNGMFHNNYSIISLDLSSFDASNVTTMEAMFQYCPELIDIKFNFRTPNVTNMSLMFDGCKNLPSLDLSMFDVSKVTDMFAIFNECFSLASINISNWDMRDVNNLSRMFDYTYDLSTLIMDGAIFPKKDLDIALNNSNKLTVESLLSVLNALPQLDGESYYVQLGSDNIAKLSDEQKAIATNKGWTLQ